jgi:hypothetical protein
MPVIESRRKSAIVQAPHRVGALEQWHRELREGKRTSTTFDPLWEAACREAADREFEAYVRPQREDLARLRARQLPPPAPKRARPARSPRLTKWRYALENADTGE